MRILFKIKFLNSNFGTFSFIFDLHKSPIFEIMYIACFMTLFSIAVSTYLIDLIVFIVGSTIVEYLKLIQKNLKSAIAGNQRAKITEQVKLHKEVIMCFLHWKDCISVMLVTRDLLCLFGICAVGFEIIVVRGKGAQSFRGFF